MQDFQATVGNLAEIFLKPENKNRGKRLSPRHMLKIDLSVGTVTVPQNGDRKNKAAFKDIGPALFKGSFASMVQNILFYLL